MNHTLLQASARHYPPLWELQYPCSRAEIGVIMHDGEVVRCRQDRCEQIRHADCTMLPEPS